MGRVHTSFRRDWENTRRLSLNIAVGKRTTSRDRLREYVEGRAVTRIDEAIWEELRSALAPVSDSYLRRLVRESGIPLVPMIEGVRQESFADLERTLRALAEAYEPSDRENRQRVRSMVLQAKEHAGWVVRSPKTDAAKRAEREEMIEWMRVWLESPDVFPGWVELRKRLLQLD
jgi:hypothetical protein